MRPARDPVAVFEALARQPWAHDFFQAMRILECAFPDKPRWGQATRPQDEPIRLSQEPALSFAPASISAFKPANAKTPPRLQVRFFGLLGPNGPLPLHLTEHAHQRQLHQDDPTFARFLDLIHHRFIALFYRAWAQAQPTVSLDRPHSDRFSSYVGSLIGIGQPALQRRDAVPDTAKLFHAGMLSRQVCNAEGLQTILASYFALPVAVDQYVGHWMTLRDQDHARLGQVTLGGNTVLGRKVWDRQSKFRLQIGPMSLERYQGFLPSGAGLLIRLRDWVRLYTHRELEWDVRLLLQHDEVPAAQLGGGCRLGWTSWLGKRTSTAAAGDLVMDPERLSRRTTFNPTVVTA